MRFEWDEVKRRSNLRDHGIDFAGIEKLFDGHTVTVEDTRRAYGEQRFVTIGLLEGRAVAVVHTERQDVIRIISVRKASKYEQRTYFSEIPDGLGTRRRSPG
jgi:uncharacterized DUF497 family protein